MLAVAMVCSLLSEIPNASDGTLLAGSDGTPVAVDGTAPSDPFSTPVATAVQRVSVTGWFTTVWGARTVYRVTDDAGREVQLQIDDQVADALGGVSAFDRKRVMVTGDVAADLPDVIRVESIVLD